MNTKHKLFTKTIGTCLDRKRLAKIYTLLKFGTVGGSGIIVNNGLLWILTRGGMGDIFASILATETAIITNFIGNSLWTWSDHAEGSWKKRFMMFQGISLIAGSLTVLLFYIFRSQLGLPLLIANTAAILITFVVNFTLNSRYTWRQERPISAHHARRGSGQLVAQDHILRIPIATNMSNRMSNSTADASSVSLTTPTHASYAMHTMHIMSEERHFTTVSARGRDRDQMTDITMSDIDNNTKGAIVDANNAEHASTRANTYDGMQGTAGIHNTHNTPARTSTIMHSIIWLFIVISFAAFLVQPSEALVSVSQMGYHPAGFKTVTVYTSMTDAGYSVVRSDGTVMKSSELISPTDYTGNPVNCQGNMPCLIGDFSDIEANGAYHITTTIGENSSEFSIDNTIYRDNIAVFDAFYDALRQQGSSYHADMNSGTDPNMPMMADGSFIMTSDQAALTLIRLSDAYRRNPTLLSSDARTFVRANTPDVVETIISYADYLVSLQDANIQRRSDGVGFRMSATMRVQNAFVPGPTTAQNLTVYFKSGTDANGTETYDELPGSPFAVVSLCGDLDGSAYNTCVADAALYYKCQVDEPCLNITYIGDTGTRLDGRKTGYGLPVGWTYEFGCFYDVDLQNGNFNTAPNPCIIYDQTENREQTVNALLAYTEAITPINQYDTAKAQTLLDRAVLTSQHITTAYSQHTPFTSSDNDTGAWGAANFLLYDLTGDIGYLDTAYDLRDIVNSAFISDVTRGEEFYWQEYVRHKTALISTGHTYLIGTKDPETYFSDKMYGDYKDKGFLSISSNGERVYQFDPNIQFQNSRYILTEGLLAAKTRDLSSDNATLIDTIADAQLSWITGNNGVDLDPAFTTDIRSVSFIFGIGDSPTQYHSRLLMDSGYRSASGGSVIGMRGTGYHFFDGAAYIYLDGRTSILGNTLGGQGNGYHDEIPAQVLDGSKAYINDEEYIPGWINGAFDVNTDTDITFDYKDDRTAYEFTESTNEIVATAISLFAYRDALYNSIAALPVPRLTTDNDSAQVSITSSPLGADVWYDSAYKGTTATMSDVSFTTTAGMHALDLNLTDCVTDSRTLNITAGDHVTLNISLNCTTANITTAAYGFASIPSGANISIDTISRGVTPIHVNLTTGQHNISVSLSGYTTFHDSVSAMAGIPVNITYALKASNDSNASNSTPPGIVYSVTNATLENGTYVAFETDTISFTVQYDTIASVQWFIDGTLLPSPALQSDRHSISWNPHILYVETGADHLAKTRVAHIVAVGDGGANASFDITIKNYLNPFWRDDVVGSPNARLEVVSNNNARDFTSVQVEIEDTLGRHNITLAHEYADNDTYWKALLIDMASGNTYIRRIFVFDNTTGFSQEVPMPEDHTLDRWHYRTTTSSDKKRGNGGGGGGYTPAEPNIGPQLVYVILSKDVVKPGESIDITLDANSSRKTTSVSATFTDDKGIDTTIALSLMTGTSTYGTWTAVFAGGNTGKHTLDHVTLSDDNLTITAEVIGRSYYVVSDTVTTGEHLSLVYALLDTNTVDPGENVTAKIDARDAKGITSAIAVLKDAGGKEPDISIPLNLVTGTAQYGTWQGTVTLKTPDTTYAMYAILLSDGFEEREVRVYNQKVYVNYVKPYLSPLSGMVAGVQFSGGVLNEFMSKPTTPLFIGLVGMGIAMFIASALITHKPEKIV